MQIVLLSGKQGAGKTTIADGLKATFVRRNVAFHSLPFAGPIYEMHDFCRKTLKDCGVEVPHKIKDGNLLQLLGTEWGRKTVGENIWVEALIGRVARLRMENPIVPLIVVIPDCRFKNEFAAFPDALKIRLECPSMVRRERAEMWRKDETHQSEVDLDSYVDKFDLTFNTAFQPVEEIVPVVVRKIMEKMK